MLFAYYVSLGKEMMPFCSTIPVPRYKFGYFDRYIAFKYDDL